MKRLIFRYRGGIVSALMEENRLLELCPYTKETNRASLGHIFIGKVKNIVKNIDAAFVDIGDNTICFLPLSDLKATASNPDFQPIFIQRNHPEKLCPGDELVVQVIREPIKTKQACVTTKLAFSGRYAVVLLDAKGLSISKKINDKLWRISMKEKLTPFLSEQYGIILRTNAYEVSEQLILEDLEYLAGEYQSLLKTYSYRTVYSELYSPDALWLSDIRDTRNGKLTEIETDDTDLYQELKQYAEEEFPQDAGKLVLHDDGYPLMKRYNLEKQIEEALYERVWLPSGAYLVIQPTEALVVIDVNTGKSVEKKDMQEHIFRINMEAAREVVRQLRLRNLSGIIIVDFINMKSEEYKNRLLQFLENEVKQDPILTTLVGMSQLELVQITRRKVRKPIYETFLAKKGENTIKTEPETVDIEI